MITKNSPKSYQILGININEYNGSSNDGLLFPWIWDTILLAFHDETM